jgi:arylsulfatase A-like enzyme
MAARRDIGHGLAVAAIGWVASFAVTALFLLWRRGAPVRGAGAASDASADVLVAQTHDARATAPPVAVAAPVPTIAPVPAKRSYNVLLLTVDTLRYDLGYMGYPKPITPNIDALAARSVVFERTYATASFTPKSLGPLMIGKYASETSRDFEHYTSFFSSNVFLAERVHASGVRTFAGMCHRYFTFKNGLKQGFDVWDTSAMPPKMTDNDSRWSSDRLTEVALSLLGDPANTGGGPTGDHRFFAWFHYFDPHLPYVPHAGAPDLRPLDGSKEARARAPYDEEVWFTDHHIGRVLAYVASQPWGADTAIILTADHGEAFGEHNHIGHGRELWESLVRVPLIVYVPGVTPKRVALKRSHIDLAPTIVELTGAPLPSDRSLRGTSLVSDVVADPRTPLPERDVYIDMPEGPFNEMRRALITRGSPGAKLIDLGGQHYELYDLARDPEERHDLAGDKALVSPYVEGMQRLRAQLQEIPPVR